MRKRKIGRKLSLETDQRKALLRSLSESLFLKEKIKTTEAKAREVSRFAEKIITRAKGADLASRKFLAALYRPESAQKIFKEIAPRYKERKGGYTRIIRLGPRKSDGAKVAIIELVK